MSVSSFTDIGRALVSRGYGREAASIRSAIQAMSDQTLSLCVLSDIARLLVDIERHLRPPSPPKADEPSDGMLLALLSKGVPVAFTFDLVRSELSIRARKAINRAQITSWSDLTIDVLLAIPNCGKHTVNEIMEFKARHTGVPQ